MAAELIGIPMWDLIRLDPIPKAMGETLGGFKQENDD